LELDGPTFCKIEGRKSGTLDLDDLRTGTRGAILPFLRGSENKSVIHEAGRLTPVRTGVGDRMIGPPAALHESSLGGESSDSVSASSWQGFGGALLVKDTCCCPAVISRASSSGSSRISKSKTLMPRSL
jgi:hypothetical protein